MSESLSFIMAILPELLRGTGITLFIFLASLVFGGMMALVIAVCACYGSTPVRAFAKAYIFCVRGTPILVQLYLCYFGLGLFLAQVPFIRHSFLWPLFASTIFYAILILSLNAAAYMGEVLRGAIGSVNLGTVEAALSVGLPSKKVFFLVTLPLAIRAALPALNTETVILVKITSLASTISVMDLMGTAYRIQSETFMTYETLIPAAVIYFVIVAAISSLLRFVERRFQVER